MARGVMVFACGHPLRGDDAVAYVAVRALPPDVLARAEVKLTGALEPEYVRDVPAGARVIIVDAVVGPPPGELVELPLAALSGRAEPVVTASTHQLPLDQVVALGQLLREAPVVGRFVGLGIASVEPDEEPTAGVVEGIPELTVAVARAIVELDPSV